MFVAARHLIHARRHVLSAYLHLPGTGGHGARGLRAIVRKCRSRSILNFGVLRARCREKRWRSHKNVLNICSLPVPWLYHLQGCARHLLHVPSRAPSQNLVATSRMILTGPRRTLNTLLLLLLIVKRVHLLFVGLPQSIYVRGQLLLLHLERGAVLLTRRRRRHPLAVRVPLRGHLLLLSEVLLQVPQVVLPGRAEVLGILRVLEGVASLALAGHRLAEALRNVWVLV